MTTTKYLPERKGTNMEIIKVAIADANIFVREGLRRILAMERDLLVVGEAANEVEVAEVVERTRPDVLLLDLEIPRRKAVEILLELKRKGVPTEVFILCSFPDEAAVLDAAKAGARGYIVLNGVHPSTIIHSIRRIHAGETWVDRQLSCSETFAAFARQTFGHDNEGDRKVIGVLSKREQEIISLVAEGLTNENISKKLFISQRTVKIHLNNIFRKLGVKNRTQAALLHVQHQIRLTAA